MKVIYVFVNFNNSIESIETVESIDKFGEGGLVILVDNCSSEEDLMKLKSRFFGHAGVIILENSQNVGYFPGLNVGINYVHNNKIYFDFIVVGNNDLSFPLSFISKLKSRQEFYRDVPVISPDIVTLDGVHQNPHVLLKIGVVREVLYDLMYSSYTLFKFFIICSKILGTVSKRGDENEFETSREIYQGYGACYILSRKYFEFWNELPNDSFLFYEEFFLAHQLESQKFKVYYDSYISLIHRLHKSTSIQPKKVMWEHARISHWKHRRLNKIRIIQV
jgi:GT2 family glycosyltransferase